MKRFLTILALLACLLPFGARAVQNATQLPTSSPYAGLTMLNNINSAFSTFQSNYAGASAPVGTSIPVASQFWSDTTDSTLRFYDGTNWLPTGKWSGSQWVPVSNGVPYTIPTATGSSNAYVVTYSPTPTALVTGQHYPFIANFQNTGAATEYVIPIGTSAIKKQGGTALASGDIVNGAVVDTVYDGTNFQMTSEVGNSASGTVTSIATNNGITGGTITSSGTIGLATIAASSGGYNGLILSNISGSTAVPTANTLTGIMDAYFSGGSPPQGALIFRNAAYWDDLSPGTSGQPLLSGGSSANPGWGKLAVGAINATGSPGSSTYLRGDGSWATVTSGFSSCTQVTASNGPATCGGGYTLTGGGCKSGGGSSNYLAQSYPPTSNSWDCVNQTGSYTSYAICCH